MNPFDIRVVLSNLSWWYVHKGLKKNGHTTLMMRIPWVDILERSFRTLGSAREVDVEHSRGGTRNYIHRRRVLETKELHTPFSSYGPE